MNFNNISAWCIRNPVVPIILFVGLCMLGIVSFSRMQVQDMPDIEFPAVVVQITQPGAAPTEIETQITQKIEAAVRTIQGVDSISSSASEGSSQTFVIFQLGIDVNNAVNEVKNTVDRARGGLPEGILEPQVQKVTGSTSAIAYYAVSGDDMTMEQLSWYVDDTVSKRLLAIPGSATVQRSGGVDREIRVTLDPARMQSLGITAGQVNQALKQLNTNAAGGKAEIAGARQSVRVLGDSRTAWQLSQIQVPLGGGRVVKLSDFADVRDGIAEPSSLGKMRGKPMVTFALSRARGASDVSVYDAMIPELAAMEKERPGLHFTQLFTSVGYTKSQYDSSMAAMVEGAVLAVIVVFFFLRDWRATVISAIAIPLSAIPTFWFLQAWFGFTLNSLSLLALGLVAGVLVDDAIVEIENIVRHMRMGKSAYQAAIDAADEIGLAVVATTFSIVAVFLPVGMMGGIPGQFFKNFGLTVVVSVLLSLAVARMITPMVAAYFLKAHGEEEHAGGVWMDRYIGILHWTLDNRIAKAMRAKLGHAKSKMGYYLAAVPAGLLTIVAGILISRLVMAVGRGLGWLAPADTSPRNFSPELGAIIGLVLVAVVICYLVGSLALAIYGLWFGRQNEGGHHSFSGWCWFNGQRLRARLHDHRVWMIGLGFASLMLTAILFKTIPGQFFPTGNFDFSRVQIEMVPGTTLAQTSEVADRVAAIINAQPEVQTAFANVREGNGGILVTYRKDRKRSSQQIEQALTPQLQAIPDARVSFAEIGPASGGGPGGGGSGRPISIMLSGSDSDQLQETAAILVEQMKGIKELVAPRVAGDMRRPEVIIKPRLDLAASLGVTTSALSQAIRIATIGDIDQNAAKFSLNDRQIPIRVRLSEESRRNIATLQNLPVATGTGGSVPLSSVADISIGSGPVSVQRYNQNRRIFIGADLAPGVIKGTAQAKIDALPIMKKLPDGVTNPPFGADRWQKDMVTSFSGALAAGVLLVFSVLVLLYHRFVSPLVNMGSLFLAPLGGLLMLLIFGQAISLPVFIGILMLFGIVAKNSILLIDFAIEEMALGRNKYDAIIEAGHKRAQPIVMTTVAMTAGMIPTAVSLGGDGAWRAPMGTVVIGGLIMSTLLTLLIVPAGFSLADGLEKRIGPWMRNKFLSYEPEHGAGVVQPAE